MAIFNLFRDDVSSYDTISLLQKIVLLFELIDKNITSIQYITDDPDRIPRRYQLSRIPSLLSDLISIYFTIYDQTYASIFDTNIKDIVSAIQNLNIEEYSKILFSNLQKCQEEYQRHNMYTLIIESIDIFDAGFDPEDFNLVRNKKNPKNDCIYFTVQGLGVSKQFYESCYMPPTVLRQKIHFIFPNLENFSILNSNFNIFAFKSLLEAGVKNGDKLTLTSSSLPYFKNTTTIFKYLFDHKITSLLIQSLKSDISGFSSLKLLKRLPDDKDVLKNNDIKGMSEREIIYYISVLKKEKLSDEIYSNLSEIFMTSGSKIEKYLTKMFLLDFRPKLINFKASDLINFLDKNSEIINLFAKLIEFDENLIEKRHQLLTVLEQADSSTASELSRIYSTIKNSEKFVDEISENLTKNFLFLILSIVNQTKSSDILEQILDKIQHSLAKNENVVQIIAKIIEKDKNLIKKLTKTNKDQIFSIALSCSDQNQYSAVNIIKEIGCEGYENQLSKFYSNKIQNWSFSPISPNKTVPGVGLKNLGMTCYMNSVMQQLFALSSFVKTVFDTENSLESLKQLFSDMSEEKLPYADMSDFVNEWKWGTQKVNCFEQQDALEFLSMFLDSMPKNSSQFFIGEYENVLTDDKGEIISKNIENFDSIEVEIKNTIEDSMTSSSVFPDYKIDDKTVTVTKTTKVKKFPEVLVIQLKRFDYNLRTFEKIKVNTQFKYPNSLNLKNIEGEVTNYNLTGIVAHAGNAVGGHYISFIKYQENKWKIFDDTDTRIARTQDMYNLYGTSSADQYTPNAYILFYTKKDEKIYQKLEIPQKYKKASNEKIQNLSEISALYTRNSYELSIISNHLLDFYFNVYMHSTMSNLEKQIIDSLSDIDNLFDKLMEREEDVLYCLANCPNYEILNSLHAILKMNSLSFTRDFVNHLLILIENSGQNWRIVNSICSVLAHYILCHPNQNDFIYRSLCGYLLRFYDKPSTSLNVVNFSPLFNLFTFEKYPEVKETIKAISNKVIQNENHKSQFETVLAYYADIETLPQIIVQARSDPNTQAMLIKIIFNVLQNVHTTKEQLKKMFDTVFIMKEGYSSVVLKKIVVAMIMKSLEKENFLDLITDNLEFILTPILCHLNLNTTKKLAETLSYFIVPSACIPPFKEAQTACQFSSDSIKRYTIDEYMKSYVPSQNKKEKITPKVSDFTQDELRRANKLKDFVVTFVKSVIEKPIKLSIRTGNYLQHPIIIVQRIAYFCGQILGFEFIKPFILPLFEKFLPKNKNEEFLPCSSLGSLMSMCEIYLDQYVDFIASIEKIDPSTLRHLKNFICNLKDDDLKLFVENKNSIKVMTEMAKSTEGSVHKGIFQIVTKALFVTDNKLFFDACVPDMSNNVMKLIPMPKILTIIDRLIPFISEETKMAVFRYTIEKMIFIASQTQRVDEEKLNETISIANIIGQFIENPVLSEEEIQKIVEFPNPASVSLILKNTNQIEELQKTEKGIYISILALFLSERIEMAMKYESSVEFWKAAMISPKPVLVYITKERFVKTPLSSRIKTNAFTKGIKMLDEENVVELFGLMTAEIFEDDVDEKEVLKKLELIVNCRPELKESFIGLLPLSKEDLIEKNARSLINALDLN
ncbi:Clan CA, family C19, ubiquitin hydrolase-like cysteine peptidase [Trichomonas vaginalis G3]|uniref:Clan CA, family C19, ubiquitin hydrolase-like cysteine peptidase n=1 Tax=Trichomonas vaginalis (strain ATCC PRA-98 / G3) TaxID=412133 RepID=A2EK42_TRIV3|nr:ubiquitinyl hydrolase protein [Trichomonas vaginalis G3]EAY06935.1 Clan CA, family C19, ubiquitin hydrolase-like cysteine peptidase [Trichomonas vaginalis G3]KAI5499086.1 ubiquitinyl hydrolase protein [Trichomonas vaginalis G3]|eukprot:XP_001319158.1 Clan CA, family C19, ubiquitin hydrolase-like cysteine peptidase [Trichomonas vaginalis G3]